MVSKACTVAAYRRKLEEMAKLRIDLTLVVPPRWGSMVFEPGHDHGYRLVVMPPALNGRHHLHWYPGLRRLLEEERPDLVHIDEEPYDFVTFHSLRLAKKVNAKSVFFTWQNLHRSFPPPFSFFERRVLANVDGAIIGNTDAGTVLHLKGYLGRTFFIRQFGIDPDEYSPVEPSPTQVFRIGFAGRLVPEKGVLVLLDAVRGLRGSWQLSVRGSGPQRAALERRIAEFGLGEQVRLEPAVPSSMMPDFYRSLDVLVCPSLSTKRWVEQYGRVLIEAMACGIPVIGSDSGEIPHVIGDAGLVCAEGNADALREELQRLMDTPALRVLLSLAGRERATNLYTHEHIARQTEEAYRAVLDG
jgi:glycosyltransferase involved in cell wall biosynthesis